MLVIKTFSYKKKKKKKKKRKEKKKKRNHVFKEQTSAQKRAITVSYGTLSGYMWQQQKLNFEMSPAN